MLRSFIKKEEKVNILIDRPVMFEAGIVCKVHMTKEGLAADRDPKYPLRDYHGKEVMVITQKDAKGKIIRDTYPDDEGLVDVHLPFPFTPPGEDAKPVYRLPVPYGVLSRVS